jgi:hypothetical protein
VSLNSTAIAALVVATILVATLVLFIVFIIRRSRERRRKLTDDLAADRDVVKDRAYNALRLASAEAVVLERDGVDINAPRGLITQAEGVLQRGDPYHALTLARQAQESLVRLRRVTESFQVAVATGADGGSEGEAEPMPEPAPLRAPSAGGSESSPDPWGAGAPTAPTLQTKPVEARFQIKLLTEELEEAERQGSARPEQEEAAGLLAEAQAALEAGNPTEALRLALKGRRRVGGHVESLPPTLPPVPPATPPAAVPDGGPATPPALPTPSAAGPRPCPRCGKPSKTSDLFCRACGAPVASAQCPRCQAPLEPDDRFCPRCGAPSG